MREGVGGERGMDGPADDEEGEVDAVEDDVVEQFAPGPA